MESTIFESDADRAADEICAALNQWTSSQLGTAVPRADGIIYERDKMESIRKSQRYHGSSSLEDPDAWENEEDDVFYDADATMTTPQSGMEADETELLLLGTASSKTKRTKTFHRAGTPVMSNSAKRMQEEVDNSEEVPYNVQSPWMSRVSPMERAHETPLASSPSARHATPRYHLANPQAAASPFHSTVAITSQWGADVRPYFRATEQLLLFHRKKQQQQYRTKMAENTSLHLALEGDKEIPMEVGMTALEEQHVSAQELKVELDFLLALHRNGWTQMRTAGGDDDISMLQKEGNFWLLLASLRKLGLACLLWDHDTASQQQHRNLLQSHMQRVARQTELTPAAILRRWYATPEDAPQFIDETPVVAPLILLRQKQILSWLHQCFQNVLPPDVRRPRRTKIIVSQGPDPQQETGFFRTDKDEEILSSCLALLLAGRLSEAQDLVRNSGVSWRAALWGGGAPHGYEFAKAPVTKMDTDDMTAIGKSCTELTEFQPSPSSLVSVGNPRRALWRRMMWKHAEQLVDGRERQSSYDVAMSALLSSNLKIAFDCTALRTWECGLYTVFRCMMDRLEDEVLHQHNEYRRQVKGPIFPGTEFAAAEREHLEATAEWADFDEEKALMNLAGTPYDEMRDDNIVTQAISAFLIGKGAIQTFMQRTMARVNDLTEEELRFLTHIAIYLDMLSLSATTPVVVEGARQWKDELVLLYLDTLLSHEDLWYMLVLYASFLPKSVILDRLPSLLEHIQSNDERSRIVEQLSEMLPEANLDLQVLRGIVALVLSESEEEDSKKSRNLGTPTRLDVRKMESVLWLSFQDNHMGDALIAANTLLRQFFLSGPEKFPVAIKFTEIVLNDLLSSIVANDQVVMIDSSSDEPSSPELDMRIHYARLEHSAYLLFLEATKRCQHWKSIIGETKHIHASKLLKDESIDASKLNSVELSIAMHADQRNIIENKRTASQSVLTAAEAACVALRDILEYPGGWLLTTDEVVAPDDFEGRVRQKELDQLRCTLLRFIALTYYDVCIDTAAWISKSLDDAAESLNITAYQAVHELDDSSNLDQTKSTSKSPVAPRFWTQRALKLADMIESCKVRSAFGASDFKTFLSLFAEATVLDSVYRYAE